MHDRYRQQHMVSLRGGEQLWARGLADSNNLDCHVDHLRQRLGQAPRFNSAGQCATGLSGGFVRPRHSGASRSPV